MAKVAFLGLGVMGYPMAGYLKKAGHDWKLIKMTTLILTILIFNLSIQPD